MGQDKEGEYGRGYCMPRCYGKGAEKIMKLDLTKERIKRLQKQKRSVYMMKLDLEELIDLAKRAVKSLDKEINAMNAELEKLFKKLK